MEQQHQKDRILFQNKKRKNQADTIAEQQKRIEEWIKQQQKTKSNSRIFQNLFKSEDINARFPKITTKNN